METANPPPFSLLVSKIENILRSVPDPEIPVVSVVDLGIVQIIEMAASFPRVTVTPTYTGCPATAVIQMSIREALDAGGFERVELEMVLSPAWSTDMISQEGRDKLRAYGIAPPPMGMGKSSLKNAEPVECPQCDSKRTKEVSRFGSTLCKALWQCEECGEPFDRFKCH